MKNINLKGIDWKKILGVIVLLLFAGAILIVGYRVIVTADNLPGRLTCISDAAGRLNYSGYQLEKVKKITYDNMKYGYMQDILLAQMDALDKQYEEERISEIRAVNDLTAMKNKTKDKVAYEKAKKEQEEKDKEAKAAAIAAEAAKEAQRKLIAQRIKLEEQAKSAAANSIQNIDTGDSSNLGYGDTASNGGQIGEPVYATTHGESLGEYLITAYCTCRICCGVYSGHNRTSSGTIPTTNRTLAVDTSVIPFGTRLVINGQVYVAEDRGGAIKGKRIDMFFYTHQEALRWGKRTMEVFLAE